MVDHSLLIVEDEQTLRRLLEHRLGRHYRVRTAADGKEALARVSEEPPDLIISDIMMPRMDGFALQEALQSNKDTRAIPFIFLTAKADEQTRRKGRRTGVDDYITKPFDIDQLLSRVERLLERTDVFRSELGARIGQDFSRQLMPRQMPDVAGYRLFSHNRPHAHGGGDLFDWMEADPGVYFITVGDVMGKGVRAKFYAYGFLSYMRNTLRTMLHETSSPARLMQRVNQMLLEDEVMTDTFASLLIIRWEPAAGAITYANAGHCRPVLLTPKTSQIVEYSDLILGLEASATFEDQHFTMPPSSALMLYTDGLIEQHLASGAMIGEEGVLQIAAEVRTADRPIEHMLDAILQHSPSAQFEDDIFVLWLQRLREKGRKGEWENGGMAVSNTG